jgi:DNA adenine methylase
MPTTDSPLRYPGGKSQLTPLVVEVLRENRLFYGQYVEPCAGGAGIAWKLLLNDYVSHVHINDIDPAIYAFWRCVLNKTDELCDRIASCKVSMTQWYRQRAIQKRRTNVLDLGFSTLFLNRTNRSGIISGGVIGGRSQKGDYPIDCRFYRETLIRKIRRIAGRKEQISLHRLDAKVFLDTVVPDIRGRTLVNLDPPYFEKGPDLYTNHYTPADHLELAKSVARLKHNWMVTYDDTPETRRMYEKYPSFTHELAYTAQDKRIGVELLVLDPRLSQPAALKRSRAGQSAKYYGRPH